MTIWCFAVCMAICWHSWKRCHIFGPFVYIHQGGSIPI